MNLIILNWGRIKNPSGQSLIGRTAKASIVKITICYWAAKERQKPVVSPKKSSAVATAVVDSVTSPATSA